jgi:DNA-directed RNA polymerase alpha subunit
MFPFWENRVQHKTGLGQRLGTFSSFEPQLRRGYLWKNKTINCIMTDKELKVKRCELDVRSAESKLREAQRNLDEGYRKSQAQIEQVKADVERDYSKLKEEVERAKIQLEMEKAYHQAAEAELARGYQA